MRVSQNCRIPCRKLLMTVTADWYVSSYRLAITVKNCYDIKRFVTCLPFPGVSVTEATNEQNIGGTS
jgi:hypothetical protein